MFLPLLRQLMLSQARARLPSGFFVWAAEIVTYLSRSAAGFAAICIVSTHRFKGVSAVCEQAGAGETGNIYRNRRVTIAH